MSTCRLAKFTFQPQRLRACSRGRLKQALDDWLTSEDDPEDSEDVDLLPEDCTECFECSGVVGECASCGGFILCGVFHAGRLKLPDSDDEASSLISDYSLLTFHHYFYSDCEGHKPQISSKWEQLLRPMADTPGKDVGITKREYSWLLKQCHAKADWQLREYRVSWSGKLLRGRRPHIEWRSEPPDDWSSIREDAENNFRARKQPLRREPEWQFDDLDVGAAWKRFDPLVLDSFAPEDLVAVGTKATASLGRWPRQAIEDAATPSARLEILLARFLDAAIAKPLFFYARADFFKGIRGRSQLVALRRNHTLADSAAKPVGDSSQHAFLKEMVQSLGLEPQPVSASAVFRHTPAQNIRCVDL